MSTFSSRFTIIAAHHNGIIGSGGSLPWNRKIPSDLRHFRNLTMGGIVIVGRKTYETLPTLEGREIVILSKEHEYIGSNIVFSNFKDALIYASSSEKPIFVIGGGEIYKEAIEHPACKWIELSEIEGREEYFDLTDNLVYFPDIPSHFSISSESIYTEGEYKVTRRRYKSSFDTESQEVGYLNLLNDILVKGDLKENRTGVKTLSLFGKSLSFDFIPKGDGYYSFPLFTTKKMFYRGIIEELIFFLQGHVDNDILKERGVTIWNGNTTREFLDSRGLTQERGFEEGSLGKAYGFQWRHWGAKWEGKNANYKGKGYDQISSIISTLKNDPSSRRIILSAWNVSDLDEMCLPPCHTLYVFNVTSNKLYCHLTQRSGDMFLGIPFNIASASLLTFILAKTAGLEPGGLVMSIVDAHVYVTHLKEAMQQLERTPYDFPRLKIRKELSNVEDIEALIPGDISIMDYQSHPAIKADMII